MDPSITIRRATEEDAKDLHTFGLTMPELQVSSQVEFMYENELRNCIANPGAVTFLAKEGDEVVGFCLGTTGDPDHCADASQACIVYLAVSEKWRRKALATTLFQWVMDGLKANGVSYLYVWACPTSGMVDFCAKQGMIKGRTCVWMDMSI